MRAQHLLPPLLFGWKTPAKPKKNKVGCRTAKRRRIPQDVIRAMRAEWEALPLDSNGHKPRACYKMLGQKYKISQDYTYNLLTMGLRDDERETTLSKGPIVTQHPAAEAAKERAAESAAKRVDEKAAEYDLTTEFGLRFLHIRNADYLNQPLPYGGATIAYTFAGRDRVNVAVATCHKIDLYSKAIGRLTAAINFKAGNYITLRVPKGLSPVQFLQASFVWAGQPSVNLE